MRFARYCVQVLSSKVFVPERSVSGPFVFSVDHCFPIRGQGTVMTGTVLSGSVALNDVSPLAALAQNYVTIHSFSTSSTDDRDSLPQGDQEGQVDANVSQASSDCHAGILTYIHLHEQVYTN